MSLVRDGSATENSEALSRIVVRCMDCGTLASAANAVSRCERCGGLLDAEIDPGSSLTPETVLAGRSRIAQSSGVWRYQALLPALPESAIVSRAEGNTPIYFDDRIAGYAGVDRLGLKHEGQNPTGSFKDRGMTVGISHAKAVGARIVACASTGNTSASLASYAAAAGLSALVLIPEGKIAGGKLAQTIAHGARIVQVEGDFDIALRLLRELTDKHPVYLVNSVNPFRLEGQKTIVFELFEQLNWHMPDVIALPGGNLGNTAAFGKALTDLFNAGLIARLPRLATIQAEGAAPFAAYYRSGFDRYEAVTAETVATAIKIGDPASVERARRAIQLSDGVVTTVSDEEILDAKAQIDRAGIGCEPASAASLAGVRRLVREGAIKPDETVVGILTGHVLKDADAVVSYHLADNDGAPRSGANRPVTIAADMASLERTLADALHG
jgi:threonine synthase